MGARARADPVDAPRASVQGGVVGETRPTVLVVDDFADAREMYGELLAKSGYTVSFAQNGEQAVALAKALRPAVILMDLSMPVMNGIVATQKIRKDTQTSHARVIAITGHAESALAVQARELCDAFMIKPSTPAEVMEMVRSMLVLGPRR